MANRLKEKYLNEVVPALTEQFNYSSVMAVPKVDKISILTKEELKDFHMETKTYRCHGCGRLVPGRDFCQTA